MIKRGILVFDHRDQEWRVWIGQTSFWIDQGYTFELRIQNRYFTAYLEKDLDWFVTLENDTIFVLHSQEVYKIRININDYIQVGAPL
ncbi:DUF5348 domain-containing protein [Neobacillus sp. PS3-12]|uniref:DUF5348 domain-containing protein n=1 Tax=Neobacillus sp. PS3-12 TaxID=3070677 RepID=UPI0027DF3580|nr:DUF5348 domain-containing protein [Neobacillus sp. PS3-12]WML53429.1 DUF5348 domain-containing protein [Neobacillus sp. PS3-12]